MNRLYFLFGVHNHQPVGNFEYVLDKAYNESYKPFADILNNHPNIKFTLHCSGILWDFFIKKYPEYISIIKKMVNRKQVEILTGGYYEPILPSIPDCDKIGQINKLTKFIKTEFGIKPRGLWLAERVWEQSLVKLFKELDIEYTTVDDYHFIAAGISPEDISGYYITEDQGFDLKIFPINQILRYYIPFRSPEEVIEYFRKLSNENRHVVVMIDDGEKFGLWPGTYKLVYNEGWLDKFLSLIEQNSDWLKLITCSEYIDMYSPKNRIYLPDTSYFEMTEWTLPTKTQIEFDNAIKYIDSIQDKKFIRKFLRGGIWRNFLIKYPESNNMNKKMLYVSKKVNNMKLKTKNRELAINKLYEGQCNCAYWHGIFGGLYLPHLRNAIYKKLIEAEKIADENKKNNIIYKELDFDNDSEKEILIETGHQNIYFIPHYGGTIFEWDIKSLGINLLNVLTRRQEAYHERLKEFLLSKIDSKNQQMIKTIHELINVKENNLDKYLHYDWYRRLSLIDHFIHPDTKYINFKNCKYGEQGDFVLGKYNWKYKNKKLNLVRDGIVWVNENQIKINIDKTINLIEPTGINVVYKISNLSTENISVKFGSEFNFAFSEHKNELDFKSNIWEFKDELQNMNIKIEFDRETNIWIFPIETVSMSEYGFERTYQGTAIFPWWEINLNSNSIMNLQFTIKIEKL